MMAGAAQPGVPAGALSMKAMIADVLLKEAVWMGVERMRFRTVKMRLQGRQAIDLKYSCACLFTRYAESHGQLLA